MNENSPQPPLAINDWLAGAKNRLANLGITSARLDAEIILAHTIRKNRTYLHAHGDELLTDRQIEIADARLELRCDRTPIAYIIGHKEFYGRSFQVTPATLIPRPESETIIDILKELSSGNRPLFPTKPKRLIDVGTGSGCLGITAKIEFPEFDVTLADISNHALNIAKGNASRLGAEVKILRSNLLAEYPFTPDIILANLPYVNPEWERSPETDYEPSLALFAENNGLAIINQLIEEAAVRIPSNSLIFFEADPRQHASLIKTAKIHGFAIKEIRDYTVVCEKI